MAWQLHYTSVEVGPGGQAGFQIVASTPGLPSGLLPAHISPRLSYRPPPDAPVAPTAEEIARLPVALSHQQVDGVHLLVRCRYLGQDYSGRYGNFLGHAIAAASGELTGVRPIELWHASAWAEAPAAPGTALAEVDDLMPVGAEDPYTIGDWLRAGGEDAYLRLESLLDAVRARLARGHGRAILVGQDVEEIVRWIAAVSYSLPWREASELSFLTYSADPAGSPHTLIGTTPGVWIPADTDALVVHLDKPFQATPSGRYARTAAACWRTMDMEGIDALGELPGDDPEVGAALLALCRGDESVTVEEQRAIAVLVAGAELPESTWDELAGRVGSLTHELAVAVTSAAPARVADLSATRAAQLCLRDPALPAPTRRLPERFRERLVPTAVARLDATETFPALAALVRKVHELEVPVGEKDVRERALALAARGQEVSGADLDGVPVDWRPCVLAGLVAGLEQNPERDGLLNAEVCAHLVDWPWHNTPMTGLSVLREQAVAGRVDRVTATVAMVPLGGWPDRDRALEVVWREPPSMAECERLIDLMGAQVSDSFHLSSAVTGVLATASPDSEDTLRFAERVRTSMRGFAAAEAEAVLLCARAAPDDLDSVGRAFDRLSALRQEAHPEVLDHAVATLAKRLRARPAFHRAAVLAQLNGDQRAVLVRAWLDGARKREEQVALIEVAIRLRARGAGDERLEAWATEQARGPMSKHLLEAQFKRDEELLKGLRELIGSKPRRSLFGWSDR